MVLQKINITKMYLEAPLGIGMQKRTMIDINNVKKVAQAIDYLIEVARETFNSVTNNSSGGNTIGKISSTVTTTEVVTKGSGSTLLGTSPDVYSWDPIRILNPEWLVTHTPFSIESTVDTLLIGLILFIIALIVIVYVMWGAYYSNVVTSFLIGKKKLPVYHLALISIAVLVGVLTLSLIYAAVFAGIMVESASLNGLSRDIAGLQSEIEELQTLLELHSKS